MKSARTFAVVLLSLTVSAQDSRPHRNEFDKWHFQVSRDDITDRETFSARLLADAPPRGWFETNATCGSAGVFLQTTYLTGINNEKDNPGTFNHVMNKMLVVRMNFDGQLRTARSLPQQFNNSLIFWFPAPDATSHLGDLGGFVALSNALYTAVGAPNPGTPSELFNGHSLKVEIPLGDGGNPVLRIQPQDTEFQKFASRCVQEFPNLIKGSPSAANRSPLQPQPKITSPAIPPNMAQLSVQSAFKYPNPVSGNMIYLLHDDFATTMSKNGYSVPPGADPGTVFLQACGSLPRADFVRAAMNNGQPILGTPPDQSSKCAQMFGAITADHAAMQRANLSGSASFQPLSPGEYHVLIYSYFPARPNPLYWDEKINLVAGANSFTAGPDNAKPLTTPTKPLTADINNPSPNLAVLTIHSTIPGQPNPLARIPFNLMRDDFATTVQRSGIRVQPGTAPPQAFATICGPRDAACISRLLRASVAGAAATAVSSPTGDATLPPVQSGEYYLLIYGYDASHRNIFWNEKITLTPGANSFTAGMDNAKPFR